MGRQPKPSKTPLGERLIEVREKLGFAKKRAAFAELVGLTEPMLGYYERGDRMPDAMDLAPYRHKFGVDLTWLITGEGPMFSESALRTEGADLVDVPLYEVQAAAGLGLIADDGVAPVKVAFSRAFLKSIGAVPEKCIMLSAKGDSMLPSIPDGSYMLVDQSKQSIGDDQVYVFRVGQVLKVKRAYWQMNGDLELRSDNEAAGYPPEIVGQERAEELSVIGQVLSLLRKA